jgi:hypothetical protein
MKNFFLKSLPVFGALASTAAAACYHFDGSPIDQYYQPCNTTADLAWSFDFNSYVEGPWG